MSILLSFMFVPPSLFVKVMSLISFASMSNCGFSEVKGKHVRYSKFVKANARMGAKEIEVPSKIGMLISYVPALVTSLSSLVVFRSSYGSRCLLLSSVLTLHYLKRVFEVLFIHKYSNMMMMEATIFISASYLVSTSTMIYAQHLTQEMAALKLNLTYPGIGLFLAGITGNFYHHYLLSRLRGKGDNRYKIPEGGLFGLVICPHYLFEIVEFIGVAFISQTIYAFSFAFGSMIYLTGRSYATRNWYLSKFPNFPTNVKALIPYVF